MPASGVRRACAAWAEKARSLATRRASRWPSAVDGVLHRLQFACVAGASGVPGGSGS
jgi:hypothetical protein